MRTFRFVLDAVAARQEAEDAFFAGESARKAERAELVTWAFQVFASGQWTTTQVYRELVRRGLTTPPLPRRRSKPIGKSSLHRILINPYYKGDIRYKGTTYKGKHEPLVPKEV